MTKRECTSFEISLALVVLGMRCSLRLLVVAGCDLPPWWASLAGAARDGGGCDFGVTLVWSEPCILGSVDRREGDAWSQSWLRPSDFCDDQLPSLQGPPVTLNAIRVGICACWVAVYPLCPSDISPMNGGNPTTPRTASCPHPGPLPPSGRGGYPLPFPSTLGFPLSRE